VLPSTTNPAYTPSVTESTGPCFSTAPVSLTLNLGWVAMPLQEARVAATYDGSPVSGEVNGLIRGFLTEAAAEDILFTDGPLAGLTLSNLLAGGQDSPQTAFDDRDTLNGVTGWWIYVNFTGIGTDWS
jgi:hypothetical protein